jgi:hypothetical protein
MKKYLIIAFSLLVVLLGAVACEKQGGEEEEPVVGADSKLYSCSDNDNGIIWQLHLMGDSMCEVTAKTSKGICYQINSILYSNNTFRFRFDIKIPVDKASSGKDEKYRFLDGVIKDRMFLIDICRYNDDGSRGELKRYLFE